MTSTLETRASGLAAPVRRNPAIGMWVVLIGQLMLVLDATIVNVALPHIASDLHFSSASLSWVLNAYSLAFGGLLLLGGRLGDVLGRRRVFMFGLSLFVLASFAGGLAQAPWQLITSRALQGAGAALAAPSVLALIATSAPNEGARNRALAAFSIISTGGAALAPIIGGTLTDLVSWRWTMFVNVPIGLAVLFLVPGLVTETARRHGRFDFVGASSATLAAVSIVWTVINAPDHGWASLRTIAGFVLGALLLVVLAMTERRHPHPLLRPALLRSRERIAALVAMAALYGGMLATFFLTVQLLAHQLGYSPLQAGFAFLPVPVGVFTMSRLAPRLVTRYGPSRLIATGTASVFVAMSLLLGTDASTGYATDILPSLLLLGLGVGSCFMPITVLALKGVEPEHTGAASGLMQTMQQLGGAVGLAVVASVFAGRATDGLDPALRAGYGASTALAAVALLSGVTLLLLARRRVSEVLLSA
jgi:EmrB/QacA subfamily drug resistance transporter